MGHFIAYIALLYNTLQMKYFKPALILIALISIFLLVNSTYNLMEMFSAKDSGLHGDIWFAFSIIGFISIYLIYKK